MPCLRDVCLWHEPTVRVLAQPAFRTDAVAVADDEHAQHQLRIDGRPADVAVVRLKLLVEVSQRRLSYSRQMTCDYAPEPITRLMPKAPWPAPRSDTKDYVRIRPLVASVWAGRSAA